jgi:histidine ammonia-lyase
VLAQALNLGLTPPVRMIGAIGTGDLTALASTALCLLGERPWQGGTLPPFPLDPADAGAFMSSNAATIGEAALACADLGDLLEAAAVVAALSFLAVNGSAESYSAAVHAGRPAPGPLRAGYDLAAGVLDPRTEDRPLDADVDAADRLLPGLAALCGPAGR